MVHLKEMKLFMADISSRFILSFPNSLFITVLYQVTGGQCSHCCLFISVSASACVNLSSSNPAWGQLLSPAGSMSAAWLWCQATIYSCVSADSPCCPRNVRQSIIMWPTYLPRPAHCLSYSPPGPALLQSLTRSCPLKNTPFSIRLSYYFQ